MTDIQGRDPLKQHGGSFMLFNDVFQVFCLSSLDRSERDNDLKNDTYMGVIKWYEAIECYNDYQYGSWLETSRCQRWCEADWNVL